MLTDKQFLRYQRQVALPEIAEGGQERLSKSHVLIIGCGGLGSAASLYLASAGVGKPQSISTLPFCNTSSWQEPVTVFFPPWCSTFITKRRFYLC